MNGFTSSRQGHGVTDITAGGRSPTALMPTQVHGNPLRSRRIYEQRNSGPVRVSLADELGQTIDGAWWPGTGHIANELPVFVRIMSSRLGEILGLTVNWPPFQRPPDLNWNGWRHAHQHVIVARSWRTQATVLVIPYATNQTLAQMILRRVAHQPISEAERKTAFFDTAGAILDAARQQRGDALERPSERPTGTRASQTTRRPQRSSQILVVADPINRSRALPLD